MRGSVGAGGPVSAAGDGEQETAIADQRDDFGIRIRQLGAYRSIDPPTEAAATAALEASGAAHAQDSGDRFGA